MTNTNKCCSLYFHIPFCASKCYYCDFYSKVTNSDTVSKYCGSLIKELDLHCVNNDLASFIIPTIFFGGGTPSLLSSADFTCLGNEIKKRITLSDDYEWTVECNPDSFSEKLAETFLSVGVNRLSFGIQSLDNHELRLLGRRHTAQKAWEILNLPILSNFKSVSADLIYGIPAQTSETFNNTLDQILNTPHIKHLSIYELTINDDTPFGRHRKHLQLPDESGIDLMMNYALSKTGRAGFEHYEISNFALPLYHCRHNEVYWNHGNYIGLGTSAHSYIHPERWANVSDISEYISHCNEKKSFIDFRETITPEKIADEILLLGFRKQGGINEIVFEQKVKRPFCTPSNRSILDNMIQHNYITYNKPDWRPTEKGMLFADTLARELALSDSNRLRNSG